MLRYRRLAGVTLNVSDLARATAFYASLPGLRPGAGEAGFQVGDENARLELCPGATPGLKRFAFEVETNAVLGELAEALDRAQVAWRWLIVPAGAQGIRLTEPHSGCTVDFLAPRDVAPAATGPIAGLGHLVLRTSAYREALAFWRDVLGFHVSDEVEGRLAFLRCFPNPLHHSLAFARGERTMLHHLNLSAHDDADLVALAETLRASGATILRGPGRHTPSGSRFVYFADPDGLTLEISAGMERFDEHGPRAPRLIPDRERSLDDDPAPRDPRMFAVGEIEVSVNSG